MKKLCLFLITCFIILACNKEETKYGITNIFMPQAVNMSGGINANYTVPSGTDSSTYNYQLDEENKKINIILGVSRAGMQASEAFSVDIVTNTDTINQLLTNGILDTTTLLMPSSMYTLPTDIAVAGGKSEGTFNLSVDINQIKENQYAGKKLALAVSIRSKGKYEVAPSLATTIVIVNVDALVIGPSVNITAAYVKNAGLPFIAAEMSSGGRWGTLADWTANTAAKSHTGYGGFSSDAGGTMNLESGWGSPAIHNGKIYQTMTLPAGTYTFDVSNLNWQGTKDPAYIVIAPGKDTIPDYSNVSGNTEIYSTLFTAPKVTFALTEETKVTVGFVVDYIQDQQGFKINNVKLLNYPKHL
ncbi:protein of unknown function [Chitinophaga sp. CF118]|uniref:DUF5013 domain-containing protein n=1 Tax=Chitinophaga sp. CF118 TaxID=1884367 RepID=UPI0008E414CF|nr:DUF5013 domain-containing protein [Chitinophaga sp. CF118]SFD54975.1 protein of unknown function [Chitinophaga sp. CF118]